MGTDRWAEALTWNDTLRDADEKHLTNALAHEWQHWYADAENRRVFEAVNRLLADADRYRKRPGPRMEELEADQYDVSLPIAEWRKRHAPHVTRKQCASVGNWRWLSGGLAAAAVAAVAMLVIMWPSGFHSVASILGGPTIYQTNVGELRDVHLSDGSSIVLGGRTQLSVAFSGQRRSVKLVEGQAWFKVAHDSHWPFVVTVGDGTITDVGTAFAVSRDSDRVVVTVTEGAVEVTTRKPMRLPLTLRPGFGGPPVLAPIRVSRGEEVAFSDNGALSPVKPADTHAATAWTRGRLIFDNQPLQYVIETVDLHSSRHIAVSPSAGALRLSGIIFDSQIDDWLLGLQRIFPVALEEQGAGICIHLRDSKYVRAQSDPSCIKHP
jgi:transmembrane sensor